MALERPLKVDHDANYPLNPPPGVSGSTGPSTFVGLMPRSSIRSGLACEIGTPRACVWMPSRLTTATGRMGSDSERPLRSTESGCSRALGDSRCRAGLRSPRPATAHTRRGPGMSRSLRARVSTSPALRESRGQFGPRGCRRRCPARLEFKKIPVSDIFCVKDSVLETPLLIDGIRHTDPENLARPRGGSPSPEKRMSARSSRRRSRGRTPANRPRAAPVNRPVGERCAKPRAVVSTSRSRGRRFHKLPLNPSSFRAFVPIEVDAPEGSGGGPRGPSSWLTRKWFPTLRSGKRMSWRRMPPARGRVRWWEFTPAPSPRPIFLKGALDERSGVDEPSPHERTRFRPIALARRLMVASRASHPGVSVGNHNDLRADIDDRRALHRRGDRGPQRFGPSLSVFDVSATEGAPKEGSHR